MGPYSPYALTLADPPKWRPGEDVAAAAFLGITLYLFVEINVLIFRAFKKKRGLYFWSMEIGSIGILMQCITIILKFFASPSTDVIWPFYTLLGSVGWAMYVTAQSLVLYSRLHLVIQNQKIQRYVLWMIISTIFVFVIPIWVVSWPAYNALNYEMSSTWSPRYAIVDRYEQLGYLITESVISGLYIWSLARFLRLKLDVRVRRRRVMMDLIFVNIIVIAFDIITVLFTYTNQLGFSQPVQTFSYALKLRLEFLVLNQLMDVAARRIRRDGFSRNRYYLTANRENMLSNENGQGPTQATLPLPTSLASYTRSSHKSTDQMRPTNGSGSDVQGFEPESEPRPNSFDHAGTVDRKSFSSDRNPSTQTAKLGASCGLPQVSEKIGQHSSGGSKPSKFLALKQRDRSHCGNSGDNEEEEEEEEKLDLYMWERGGTAVLDVSWFQSNVEA